MIVWIMECDDHFLVAWKERDGFLRTRNFDSEAKADEFVAQLECRMLLDEWGDEAALKRRLH